MLMSDGTIISDGLSLVGWLDTEMDSIVKKGHMVTGIVIGSRARRVLTEGCEKAMSAKHREEMTVNRFRGALLIEDGIQGDRVEVIHAESPVLPVEGDVFSRGLKKIR